MSLLSRMYRPLQAAFSIVALIITIVCSGAAQLPARDVSKEQARPTRDWVRDGVVYEIYPRAFSPKETSMASPRVSTI